MLSPHECRVLSSDVRPRTAWAVYIVLYTVRPRRKREAIEAKMLHQLFNRKCSNTSYMFASVTYGRYRPFFFKQSHADEKIFGRELHNGLPAQAALLASDFSIYLFGPSVLPRTTTISPSYVWRAS